MAKKDFDIDFNFDEAYGFDAKSDPDDEAFLNTADSDGYSGEDFDLDGDLDNFLNMGEGEEPPVPQWQDVPEAEQAASADPAYLPNVEALRSSQPKDLDASEIEVRLGAT